MEGFDPEVWKRRLLDAARTGSAQMFRVRRQLTAEQAKAVSDLLDPLDRAAIRLAMKFGDDGTRYDRWKPFANGQSVVMDLSEVEIPWPERGEGHGRGRQGDQRTP